MRELTALERKKIQEVLRYKQPTCPGCGEEMKFGYGSDYITGKFQAWYYCDNRMCAGRWYVAPREHQNAGLLAMNLYNAAIQRVKEKKHESQHISN